MSGLTAVSLFAGIGGIDLALQRSGVHLAAAVEIDEGCRSVLARHFPETRLFSDVREVTGDDLRAAGFVPRSGIITAGWPCQGNSVAGRRLGMADPRSGLWAHVLRLLAETGAAWFIGENVPGLLSVNDGRDFRCVLDGLAGLGMGFCWRVLDAQHFGVPQRRARVLIVGRAGDRDARLPVEILLEPEGRVRSPAPGGEARPGAAGIAAVGTLQGGGRRGHRIDAEGAASGQLIAFDATQITSRENRANPQPGDPSPTLSGDGRVHVVGDPAYALTSHGNRYDREENYAVMHTLTSAGADASEDGTGRGPGVVPAADGQSVRRLTPLEWERLQGFPDGWTDGQSDAARYRQLGNSVAVPCVEWVTHRLAAASSAKETAA